MAIDWSKLAREVNAYLDGLGVYERPMDHTLWADVLGISWGVIGSKAREQPNSEWGRAVARHRAVKAYWRALVVEEARRKLGAPGHVADVARKFGLTVKQVAGIIQHARKVGDLPPSNRPKRIRRAP